MYRFAIFCIVITAFFIGIPTAIFGQEEEPEYPWVYATEYQIKDADSLETLIHNFEEEYNWIEKAKEMGYVLDIRWLFHHTGNEWNVRNEIVYASWEAMGVTGWQGKVSEVVLPDADKRKASNEAFGKLFEGSKHRDYIYRLVTGAR